MNNLAEFMDFVPVGLKPIGNIDGVNINSNDRIQNFVRNWVQSSNISKRVSSKIIEGIASGKILVGYEDKGKLNLIKNRWRDFIGKESGKDYLGYMSANEHKIGIILDENVNILGKAIRDIPSTIVHEMIHLVALDLWKVFLTATMYKFLIPFYRIVFDKINKDLNNVSDRALSETIIDVSRISDHNFLNKPDLNRVYASWESLFRQVQPSEEASKSALILLSAYYFYVMKNLNTKYRAYPKKVVLGMAAAYSKIGLKNVLSFTIPCQEAVYPSEIVCVSNQFGPYPSVVKLINSLRFRK